MVIWEVSTTSSATTATATTAAASAPTTATTIRITTSSTVVTSAGSIPEISSEVVGSSTDRVEDMGSIAVELDDFTLSLCCISIYRQMDLPGKLVELS